MRVSSCLTTKVKVVRVILCQFYQEEHFVCSFLGAASIIISAIYKRQVLSPRVHPIFVFSIADIMLSVLWIAGSALWLLRTKDMQRGWCFAASLITVVSFDGCHITMTVMSHVLLCMNCCKANNARTLLSTNPMLIQFTSVCVCSTIFSKV